MEKHKIIADNSAKIQRSTFSKLQIQLVWIGQDWLQLWINPSMSIVLKIKKVRFLTKR
ncbi:hypothetical protein TrispH2_009149 [Trichoplax sp. H2]|nr:hypothetical protein TrispH2_009149 [Trichoplax sp. H2]|eukprot:RDD37954.1 hypothetical protein TrispH2_009149 [Trichoplax sp. H2]